MAGPCELFVRKKKHEANHCDTSNRLQPKAQSLKFYPKKRYKIVVKTISSLHPRKKHRDCNKDLTDTLSMVIVI